jgi:hypothetical protein
MKRGSSMRTLVVVGGCLATLAVWGAGAGARLQAPACTAGVKTVGGATVRTFCGPAKAVVKVGGKTLHFKGGKCEKLSGYYTVNLGSITLPPAKPKYMYFGLTTTKRGGTHSVKDVPLVWQTPGKRFALWKGSVTISGSLRSGKFSGTTLEAAQKASGSWSC